MSAAQIKAALLETGWNVQSEPRRLGNTGNNRAYRLTAFGRDALLKHYFRHPDDPRDRFAAERAFYEFLWQAGVRSIPEPIAWAPDLRLGLFEFISGERPPVATEALVAQAGAFFREMNAHRHTPAAAALPMASEACFSLRAHLACVERRIARLAQVQDRSDVEGEAVAFIRDELTPAWQRLAAATRAAFPPGELDRELSPGERCLSPSDFGFHNALQQPDGSLRFFDFEYAGWDDPAKTVCDFFCQPAIPVCPAFLGEFSGGLGDFTSAALQRRVVILLPLYRLKWCCIMLNDFLPADQSRRTFSDPGHDPGLRRRAQLEKATAALRAVDR